MPANIIRTTAARDRHCESCHCPIFIGEIIHIDSTTGAFGCSAEHCQDAADELRDAAEIDDFRERFDDAAAGRPQTHHALN